MQNWLILSETEMVARKNSDSLYFFLAVKVIYGIGLRSNRILARYSHIETDITKH